MERLFETHIKPILNKYKPETILEIGVLRGESTLKLLEWCSENGSHLTSLDPVEWSGELPDSVKKPMPGYKYKRGQSGFEEWVITPQGLEEVFRRGLDSYWTCVKTRSLDYFESPDFRGFGFYVIDGDHNHYTVTRELEFIDQYFRQGDVVLFNDVAGIWAKKDLYYDPDNIPPQFVGGKKQGVLTAVKDFLDGKSDKFLWFRRHCPYHFKILTKKHYGLGIMTLR